MKHFYNDNACGPVIKRSPGNQKDAGSNPRSPTNPTPPPAHIQSHLSRAQMEDKLLLVVKLCQVKPIKEKGQRTKKERKEKEKERL